METSPSLDLAMCCFSNLSFTQQNLQRALGYNLSRAMSKSPGSLDMTRFLENCERVGERMRHCDKKGQRGKANERVGCVICG